MEERHDEKCLTCERMQWSRSFKVSGPQGGVTGKRMMCRRTSESISCAAARSPSGQCGPGAIHWAKRMGE